MSPAEENLDEDPVEGRDSATSALSSWHPEPSGVDTDIGRLKPEGAPEQSGAAATAVTRNEARASEQQAAADMSSMSQQNLGQFDEAQASRVSPESTLFVSNEDNSREQLDQNGAQSPHSTAHSNGTDPTLDQETAPKPKKRAGRPKKTDGDSTPKKKPGRRKKADTGDTTA